MEILYSIFIGIIFGMIVGMIVGIGLLCRRDRLPDPPSAFRHLLFPSL